MLEPLTSWFCDAGTIKVVSSFGDFILMNEWKDPVSKMYTPFLLLALSSSLPCLPSLPSSLPLPYHPFLSSQWCVLRRGLKTIA